MSRVGFCKRGGQEGVILTNKEFTNSNMIPLPDGNISRNQCTQDHTSFESAIYWETETGAHGWACNKCGEIIQWG